MKMRFGRAELPYIRVFARASLSYLQRYLLSSVVGYIALRRSAQSPLSGVGGEVHWGPSAFEIGIHVPLRGLNQEA